MRELIKKPASSLSVLQRVNLRNQIMARGIQSWVNNSLNILYVFLNKVPLNLGKLNLLKTMLVISIYLLKASSSMNY